MLAAHPSLKQEKRQAGPLGTSRQIAQMFGRHPAVPLARTEMDGRKSFLNGRHSRQLDEKRLLQTSAGQILPHGFEPERANWFERQLATNRKS